MLTWIIQISLISLIFIFLVHHLIMFFKSTLTVPKIKDLVNSSEQKYQKIYDTLSTNGNGNTNGNANSYTAIDLLPSSFINDADSSMKDELKSFLKKQLNNDNDNVNANTNNNIFGTNNFSNF